MLLACLPWLEHRNVLLEQILPGVSLVLLVLAAYSIQQWDEGDVGAAQNETRRVLAEMNNRIDAERKFLAGRLHDDVNHKLLEAKMYLRKLRPIIEQNVTEPVAANQAQNIVMNALDLIYETYIECRDIIKNTRVEIIEAIGLLAAITDMVNQYKSALQRPRISFDHNIPIGMAPSGDIAINVYRIIQEGLLNTIKHAKAQSVRVRFLFFQKEMMYVLEIKDDGGGMKPTESSGIGMIDMRERAAAIGATLKVLSSPSKGTRLIVKFRADTEAGQSIMPSLPESIIPSISHF